VLDRELTLQPAQTARLAHAAAIAQQALGAADAAFLHATTALAEAEGLTNEEQATLHQLRAEWYMAQGDLATAVVEAQTAAELNDAITLHLALQAWQDYLAFDLAAAQTAAETILAAAPDDSLSAQLAQRTLGGVATLQERPRPALVALDAALLANPDDIEALALRVQNLMLVSEWEAARTDVARLRAIAPTAPASLWAQALVVMKDNDLELAHVLLDQAIAQDATRPEYYWLRADTYRLTEESERAMEDVAAALALYPQSLYALEVQQALLWDEYNYQELETVGRQLIEWYPDSPSGYRLLVVHNLNMIGDEAAALAEADEAVARNPENANAYNLRAWAYNVIGDFAAAQADYEQALALDPDSPSAHTGLAAVVKAQGDLATAVALLEENSQLYPRSLDARTSLASVYMDQGAYEEAWHLLHQVLAEDPQNDLALGLRAYLYSYQGEPERAVREITKVIGLFPDNPFAYVARSGFLLDLGRFDEATEDAEKAIELDPLLADPHRVLFAVAIENGDLEEAEQQLDLWLEKATVSDKNPELVSHMQLATRRFEDVIVTTTEALATEPAEDEDSYYLSRGLAHLNLGQTEDGQADIEQALAVSEDINLIADAEVALAESLQVVNVADGRLQYTNDTFGYLLNYADWWLRRPGIPEQNIDLLLVHETDETFGAVLTRLFVEDTDVSAAEIGEFLKNNTAQQSNVTLISSGTAPFNGGNSYVIRYELDTGELNQGIEYIFTQGNRVVLLILEADENSFAELEAEFAVIAASFVFLP
jgi:tetratricopeptide (TPR) repeat protein